VAALASQAARPAAGETAGSTAPAPGEWDAAHAAAIVAQVDALVDAAVAPGGAANTSVRRRLLSNDKVIVRRLQQARDRLLWDWPDAIAALLARWREGDVATSAGRERRGDQRHLVPNETPPGQLQVPIL
jgi:hypothetical protein